MSGLWYRQVLSKDIREHAIKFCREPVWAQDYVNFRFGEGIKLSLWWISDIIQQMSLDIV